MPSRGQIEAPPQPSPSNTKELKVQIPRRLLLQLQQQKIMTGDQIARSVERALREYLRSLR